MSRLRIPFIACLFVLPLIAADAPIPPAAREAIAKRDAAIERANRLRDDAVATARRQYAKDLDAAIEAALRSKDAEQVVAVTELKKQETPETDKSPSILVTSASYGAGSSWVNVTQQMKSQCDGSRLVIPGKLYNTWKLNPAPNLTKFIRVTLSIHGQSVTMEVPNEDGAQSVLSLAPQSGH